MSEWNSQSLRSWLKIVTGNTRTQNAYRCEFPIGWTERETEREREWKGCIAGHSNQASFCNRTLWSVVADTYRGKLYCVHFKITRIRHIAITHNTLVMYFTDKRRFVLCCNIQTETSLSGIPEERWCAYQLFSKKRYSFQ